MNREEILRAIAAAQQGIEKHRAEYPENLRKGLLYSARNNVDMVNELHEEIRRLSALLIPATAVPAPAPAPVAIEPVREIERKPEPMPPRVTDTRPWWRKALRL